MSCGLHAWLEYRVRRVWLASLIGLGLLSGATPQGTAAVVDYSVSFAASWSEGSHPQDFPSNPHFSGLIGGTHNADVQFWEPGGMATPGIQRMAEFGSKSVLQAEVNAAIQAGTAFNVISGGGINPSPGSVSRSFEVSDTHPLVTITSMVAPSPDWFVGTHGLHLRPDGYWRSEVVVDLFVYDAGTDSGVSFASNNAPTVPHQPISLLSGVFPLNQEPFGTFTFSLLADTGDLNGDGVLDEKDIDELSAAVRESRGDSKYDTNGDTLLNDEDRAYWVETLQQTSFGDADLDGDVEASTDGAALLSHLGQSDLGWTDGDFDGDGRGTASGDGALLLENLGAGAGDTASSVPEPTTLWGGVLAVAVWILAAGWNRIGGLRGGRGSIY